MRTPGDISSLAHISRPRAMSHETPMSRPSHIIWPQLMSPGRAQPYHPSTSHVMRSRCPHHPAVPSYITGREPRHLSGHHHSTTYPPSLSSRFPASESHCPMASFNATMVKMVVAVCNAVLLLSLGPTAMAADQGADCRDPCVAGCQLIAPASCTSIDQALPPLEATCVTRFRGLCAQLCVTFCNANTLPQPGTPLCLNP
ncbi:hypothetical protein HU200_048696 [Digitaria exilis]|uniref:Uncharacterized protein n=1 Tax=Digitaria exilis TaxID=1010633 RepID=A0A835ECG8_9POAL|nr:hypothetical protein HU200_048696 [Digitaria exilis]